MIVQPCFIAEKFAMVFAFGNFFLHYTGKKRQAFQHLELLERYNYGDNIDYHLNRDTSLNEYNYL